MCNLKRITKRALAGTLAALLLFTSVPTSAYAISPMDTTEMEQNVAIEEVEELTVDETAGEDAGGEVLTEQSEVISADENTDENAGEAENTETAGEITEENTEAEEAEVDEEEIIGEETSEELSEEELLEEEELSEEELSEEVEKLSEAPEAVFNVTAVAADTQSTAVWNDFVGAYQKDITVNKYDGAEEPKIGSISGKLYLVGDGEESLFLDHPYYLILHLESSNITEGFYSIYLDDNEVSDYSKKEITGSGVDTDVCIPVSKDNKTLSVKYYASNEEPVNDYTYDLGLTFGEETYLSCVALTELPSGLPASFPKNVELAGIQNISSAAYNSMKGALYDIDGNWYVFGKISTSVEGANIYVEGNMLNTSDGTFAVEVDRNGEPIGRIQLIKYYLYLGSWDSKYVDTMEPWEISTYNLNRDYLVTVSTVNELPETLPQDIASDVEAVSDIQADVVFGSQSVSGTLKPVNEKFYLLGKMAVEEGFTVSVENNLITEPAAGEFLVDLTSSDAKLTAIVKKNDAVVRTIDYDLTKLKKTDIARYHIYPFSTPKQNISVKINEDGTSGTIEGTIEARYDEPGAPQYCLILGVSGANFKESDSKNVISVKTDKDASFHQYESSYSYNINPSDIPEKIIVSLNDSKPIDSNIINDSVELALNLTLIDTIEVNVELAPATTDGFFDDDSIRDGAKISVNGVRTYLKDGYFICNTGDTYTITVEAYDGAKIVKTDITTGTGNPKTTKVNKQKYTYTGVAGKDDVNIIIYGEDPIIGRIENSDYVEVSKDKKGAFYVQKGQNYKASISTASRSLRYDTAWDTVNVYDSKDEIQPVLDISSYDPEYCSFKVNDSILPNEIYSMVFTKEEKEVSTIKFTLLPTEKIKLALTDTRTNKKVTSFSISNGSSVRAHIDTVPSNASMEDIGLKVLNSKGEEVASDGSDGILYLMEDKYLNLAAVPESKDAKDKYTAVFYDIETDNTIAKYSIAFKPAKMGKPIITCLGTLPAGSDFLVQYPSDMIGDDGEYYYQYIWKNADGEVVDSNDPLSISNAVSEGEPVKIVALQSDESSKYTLDVTFIKKYNDVVYAESTATYTLSNRFASTAKDFKVKQVSKSGFLGQEVVLAKIEYAKDVAYRGQPTIEIPDLPAEMSDINIMLNSMCEYDEQTGELSIMLLSSEPDVLLELGEIGLFIDFSKLKLRIRPDIPTGCYSSVYKDINFSIDIPIMDIDVNPNPIDIVKKPGKAATGKFSLEFNQFNDELEIKSMTSVFFPKGLGPKSKKVTYHLLGDGAEDITVKNGKISVSKDYVIQGTDYDDECDIAYDTLLLYVKPDDYEEHIWGEVSPFEVRIYPDSVKYAEVVPVIYDEVDQCFVRAGNTLSMSDLYWGMMVEPKVLFFVRPSNVPVKDRYGVDELIKEGFTLTSSNKNVKLEKIDGDYVLSTPIPVAKNIVLTAKSNADSKVSAKSGKINIVSDQRDDFGIYLNNKYLYYGNNEVIDATPLDMLALPSIADMGTMVCMQVCGLDSGKNIEDIIGQGDFTVKYTNLLELPGGLTSMVEMMYPGMIYVMPKDISKPVVVTVKDNILRKTKKFTITFTDSEIKASCNEVIYNNTNPGVEFYGALKDAWDDYGYADPTEKEACKEYLNKLVDMAKLLKYRINLTIPKKYESNINEGAYLTMPNAQMDMMLNKDLFIFEAGISMATSFVNPDAENGCVPIFKDEQGYYTYFGWIDEIPTKAGKYTVGMAIMDKNNEMVSGIIPITVTLKNQKVNFKAPSKATSIAFAGKNDAVDLMDVVSLGKGCAGIVALSTEDSIDDGLPTGFSNIFSINEEGKIVISDSAKDSDLEDINKHGSGYIKYFVTNAFGVKTSGYLKVNITVTK